jgi:hypothetical protein
MAYITDNRVANEFNRHYPSITKCCQECGVELNADTDYESMCKSCNDMDEAGYGNH